MSNPSQRSLELAAQCWCKETTKNTVMDTVLATEFAKCMDAELKKLTAVSDGYKASCVLTLDVLNPYNIENIVLAATRVVNERNTMRRALAALVGASEPAELNSMFKMLNATMPDGPCKSAVMGAINTLLEIKIPLPKS